MSSVAISGPPSVVSMDGLSESDVDIGSASSVTSDPVEHPSRVRTPSGNGGAVKHPRFYYEDGSLTLLAGETLFRIHGSILAALSPAFKDVLPLVHDGVHNLEDMSSFDVASLLSVIYPRVFDGPEVLTKAGWLAVLRLANEWGFEGVKRLAIKELDRRVSPLERLVIGRTHGVAHWIEQALVALILLDELPDAEEIEKLDTKSLRDFIRITAAREAIARGRLEDSEHSVLTYVQEKILAAPLLKNSELLPAHANIATSSSITAAVSNVSQPSATLADDHDLHSVVSTTMASIHSPPNDEIIEFSLPSQPECRTPFTAPSTTTRTNDAVTYRFTYVPYSFEDHGKLLSNLSYSSRLIPAFESIALASVPAFCEALKEWMFSQDSVDSFFVCLFARATRFSDFHPAGLHIASYAMKRFQPRYSFEAYAKDLHVLNELDDVQFNDDNIRTTLDHLSTIRGSYVFRCTGERDFLEYHPALCRQWLRNLKVFLTSLSNAGVLGDPNPSPNSL